LRPCCHAALSSGVVMSQSGRHFLVTARRFLGGDLPWWRVVQKDLDIAEYTDPANNPMIPHVFVLEPGLVVYKIYNGYWFFGRGDLG
jgi:hypothetical protein